MPLAKAGKKEPETKPVVINVLVYKREKRSVRELIAWLNQMLQCDVEKLPDLRSGAEYCQIMHKLFPTAMPLGKVHLLTNADYEIDTNYKLLRNSFEKLAIRKDIPNIELIRGLGHYDFLNWFFKFHNANPNGRSYNALEERKGKKIGLKKIPEPERRFDYAASLRRSNSMLAAVAPRKPTVQRSQSLSTVLGKSGKGKAQHSRPLASRQASTVCQRNPDMTAAGFMAAQPVSPPQYIYQPIQPVAGIAPMPVYYVPYQIVPGWATPCPPLPLPQPMSCCQPMGWSTPVFAAPAPLANEKLPTQCPIAPVKSVQSYCIEGKSVPLPSESDSEDEIDDRLNCVRRQMVLLKNKLTTVEILLGKYSSDPELAIRKIKRYLRKQEIDEPFILS